MDLSFPCVGNLDDGIFHDLGLEDDTLDQVEPADSPAADPLQSMVLSPDALDLALMAFDVGDEDSIGAETNEGRHGKSSPQSPFCDAAISRQACGGASPVSPIKLRCAVAGKTNMKGANVSLSFQKGNAPASVNCNQVLQKNQASRASVAARPSNSQGHKSSPRRNPIRWPPANEKREGMGAEEAGGISNAFPPRLPGNDPDMGREVASTSTTAPAATHRPTEAQPTSRRLPARALSRPSLVDPANAQSRWARQRAATRNAAVIASSVRKEEEALAEANRTAVASTGAAADTTCGVSSTTKRVASSGVAPVGEKRKVSFADKIAGSVAVDDAAGDDHRERQRRTDTLERGLGGEGERQGEGGRGGGGKDRVQDDDDLLARASELHSSVAGQLRSVNELLKRKSYFYIDTSWSAKQLPCPPTAWKAKGVGSDTGGGGPTAAGGSGGGGAGVGTESSSTVAPRHRPATSSSKNVAIRLEGRQWVSTGSNKAKVGVYSIPGEKVHEPSWKNQDAALALAPVGRGEGQALFAIFDGHGVNGRQASNECMERLPKYLVSASRSGDPASALRRSCQRLHRDLASGVAGDCARSGTTLCAAILNGRRLTVANVGDSGCLRLSRRTPSPDVTPAVAGNPSAADGDATAAVAGVTSRRRGIGASENVLSGAGNRAGDSRGRLVAERLSRDHKPESAGELERIQSAGGVVFPVPTRRDTAAGGGNGVIESTFPPTGEGGQQATGTREQELTTARDFGVGVPRVWRAGGDGPGLAMSRSIGDKMAHRVGVTYEPEIFEFDLDPRSDVMLVLASDGVWDVMSAEDIRKAAEAHATNDVWCPQALSMDICRKSLSEWATVTSGGSDDITCLVVKTVGVLPPKARRGSPCVGATEAPRNGNELKC